VWCAVLLLCSATMSKSRFVAPHDHHRGENYDTIVLGLTAPRTRPRAIL
jgi:hypothetical protein